MDHLKRSTRARLELLGHSEEGRPIRALLLGADDAPIRVLILAGQHGDERDARTVVKRFSRTCARSDATAGELALAVARNLNPDGAARGSRANARGIDLNRDHLLLASAEVHALHRFVRSWSPHLIIDVHNYPPRRSHLLAHGLAYCHDVFLDVPTSPGVPSPGHGLWKDLLLGPILSDLAALGHRCGRYTLVKPTGRVRHSTPDVADARNGLALRQGVPCLLVEGRRAPRAEGSEARRLVRDAMTAALGLAVEWAVANRDLLAARALPRLGERVVIGSRYDREHVPFAVTFRDVRTELLREVDLSTDYTSGVEATRHAVVPKSYAVPLSHRPLLDLLERHGFPRQTPEPGRSGLVERRRIERVRATRRPDRPPRIRVGPAVLEEVSLDGQVLFPTDHEGGRALVVMLEPGSKYGLARFPDLGLHPKPGSLWPVSRIVSSGSWSHGAHHQPA